MAIKFVLQVLFVSVAILANSLATAQTFDIQVRLPGEEQFTRKGQIKVEIGKKDRRANVDIKSQDQIISRDIVKKYQKFTNDAYTSLRFQDISNPEHYYITTFNLRAFKTLNYAEILELQLNLDGQLVAINYVIRKKSALDDDVVQAKFQEAKQAFEVNFNPTEKAKIEREKQVLQQEQGGLMGFLMKYKWWIGGAFLVFYLISNVDPEKLQQTAQAQQQGRG